LEIELLPAAVDSPRLKLEALRFPFDELTAEVSHRAHSVSFPFKQQAGEPFRCLQIGFKQTVSSLSANA
jgi:hypothetical protein